MFIDNLLPRNIYPIKNNIELIYSSNEDFHVIIYYENINKIKIIVRRLDCDCGWNIDLRIKLFSLNNEDYEIISIGSYDKNHKIISYITRISIYKTDYLNQIIPKIIFQTTPNKDISNILHYNSILTFIELNPEYEYRILDNIECRKFIKDNFDNEILKAYDLLLAGSFKADLFRYCYLYIHGGCYFDCKQILRKPLRQLIEPDDEMILCNDMNGGYFNAVMMSSKKNENLLRVINLCKNKILNFNHYFNIHSNDFNHISKILGLTGPHLLYQALYPIVNNINVNINVKFNHKFLNKSHEYQKLLIEYNNEVIITKSFNGYSNNNHYSNLWFNKLILFKDASLYKIDNNEYNIFIYPHHFIDQFNFYIIDKSRIIIERIDKNAGWQNDLKINLIDETNNIEKLINIGGSEIKFKLLNIENLFEKEISYVNGHTLKKVENEFNDTFSLNIIIHKNQLKIVIIRIDQCNGWGQNLQLLYKNNSEEEKEFTKINIGPSLEFIKIINI